METAIPHLECLRLLNLTPTASADDIDRAVKAAYRKWSHRAHSAPRIDQRREAEQRLAELDTVRRSLEVAPTARRSSPPPVDRSSTRRHETTAPGPLPAPPVPTVPQRTSAAPYPAYAPQLLQEPDREEFLPHLLKFLLISFLMGLSCYVIVGVFWIMHAARRTGFRARDPILGSIAVIPWCIWSFQVVWRYTAKTMYWTPRPEYTSRPLFLDTGNPASSQPLPTPQYPTAPVVPIAPPGWHQDPYGRYELRYWDGHRWTEHVCSAGRTAVDPM